MALFGKREKVFEVWGDAPRWKAARAALKQQGIKIMESGFYDTEAPICGCGAKLDHRDFGPNGPIDRHTYYLCVRPEDVPRAKALLGWQAARGLEEMCKSSWNFTCQAMK